MVWRSLLFSRNKPIHVCKCHLTPRCLYLFMVNFSLLKCYKECCMLREYSRLSSPRIPLSVILVAGFPGSLAAWYPVPAGRRQRSPARASCTDAATCPEACYRCEPCVLCLKSPWTSVLTVVSTFKKTSRPQLWTRLWSVIKV